MFFACFSADLYLSRDSSHASLKTSSLVLRHLCSRLRLVCLRALVLSLNHGVIWLEFRFLVLRGAIESITPSRTSLNSLVKLSRDPVQLLRWLMAVGKADSKDSLAELFIHRVFDGRWLVEGRGIRALNVMKQWSDTNLADGSTRTS